MTNIDQFESVFNSAIKTPFEFENIPIQSVLVASDGEEPQHFYQLAQALLEDQIAPGTLEFHLTTGSEFDTVGKLLDHVEEIKPDIICTHRNLNSSAWRWPYSLGHYVDVLTQVLAPPVLVMPHPEEFPDYKPTRGTSTVMAITDHLSGDHRLVSYAVAMTKPTGKLLLAHVEDVIALERVMDAIGKLPELDTDFAREHIPQQLLKDPEDYIASCEEVLKTLALPITLKAVLRVGHLLNDYRRIIAEETVDLVVMNTKDDDQTAMHGLAYPLSVELRSTPLLLL